MAMKGVLCIPKAPALTEPHDQIVLFYIQDTFRGESYPSAEMQSVFYSPSRLSKKENWNQSSKKNK